jgi:hypothetical protein
MFFAEFALMVPTARLELAQLSPLPPQDSVSTNFTTSARAFFMIGRPEWHEAFASSDQLKF